MSTGGTIRHDAPRVSEAPKDSPVNHSDLLNLQTRAIHLQKTLDETRAEKTAVEADRDGLKAEKTSVEAERDGLKAEHAVLLDENARLTAVIVTLTAPVVAPVPAETPQLTPVTPAV